MKELQSQIKNFFGSPGRGAWILLLILGIVAGGFGWGAFKTMNNNEDGFKPAPILTTAEQRAAVEQQVKLVETNAQMPDATKQIYINMLRAHEPALSATSASQ